MNKSSFFNDQSDLSLYVQPPKTELQIKYEQILKQASQYRLSLRELKQENEWFRTANEGLQNECSTLKELLQEKKDLMGELNSELRLANEEINRLEDLVCQKDIVIQNLQTEISEITDSVKTNSQRIIRLQCELSSARQLSSQLIKNNGCKEQKRERQYLHQMSQRMLKVLQSGKETTKQGQDQQQILAELVNRIENLVVNQKQYIIQYDNKINMYENQLEAKRNELEVIYSQRQSVQRMLEQQKTKNEESIEKIKYLQEKLDRVTVNRQKLFEESVANYQSSIQKLCLVFLPFIQEESQTLMRVCSLMKNSKNQFELPIILQQLKIITLQKIKSFNNNLGKKLSCRQNDNKMKLIEEEYDTLKIKHNSLQRQYEAVIEDNRRILKFNQISRYRAQRNLKQNMMCVMNSNEQNKKVNFESQMKYN